MGCCVDGAAWDFFAPTLKQCVRLGSTTRHPAKEKPLRTGRKRPIRDSKIFTTGGTGKTGRGAENQRARSSLKFLHIHSDEKRIIMAKSNIGRVREYLQAIESMGSFEAVFEFFAPEAVVREFPNRVAPQGRIRRLEDMREAYEQGRRTMRSQTYKIQHILEAEEEVAVELEWTGVLAVEVMNLRAGSEMKAFVAMFLRFRDGKIVEQRNYDCYPPFEAGVKAG
jgi:ketosteroid isomerase-like protein